MESPGGDSAYDGQGDGGRNTAITAAMTADMEAVEVEEGMVATLEEGIAVRRMTSRMTMTRTLATLTRRTTTEDTAAESMAAGCGVATRMSRAVRGVVA